MCIQTAIQDKIAELTNDGALITQFLADAVRGAIPGAKACHRLDAAKTLARYGIPTASPEPVDEPIPASAETKDHTHPTLRDIVAYPIARYIRERTNEGETIIEALCDIMQGGSYSRFEYEFDRPPLVKPGQQLAAAKELMSRALGESKPPRVQSAEFAPPRPALTGSEKLAEAMKAELELNGDDPLNRRFARLVRDKTNGGIDAAETMIRIIENDKYENDWLPAHRLSASKELIHRAFDLNYDAVTWQHVEAYHKATEGEDAYKRVEIEQARHQARLSELIRQYNAAQETDDEEAMKAAEKKFSDYVKRGDEINPDDPIDYAGYGPADPDPTANFNRPSGGKEEQAKFDRQVARSQARKKNSNSGRHTAAAAIPTPTLTIPTNNRSP